MGSLALVDATTWVSDFDFTTRLNELSLDLSWEELEDTTYGTAGASRVGRSRIAGLEDVETELNGYWESLPAGSVDEAAFTGLGSAAQVVTHSVDGTEDSVAYAYQARKFNYQLGDEIGAVLPFTLGIMGALGTQAVRGRVAKAKGDVSAIGPLGSPLNLGAGSAGEFLYAVFHVFTAGTTITINVESAPTSAFVALDTVTRATIGPLTAKGGTWMPPVDASAITHPWYRFNVTAITGTFTVAGAIAVE